MTIKIETISKVLKDTITKQELLSWKDSDNHNFWHLFSTGHNDNLFFKICNKVNQKELISKLSEKNDLGDTPVHIAAWSNASNIIDYLHNQGIVFKNFIDNQSRTVPFIAIEMQHEKIIDTCLKQQIDLTQTDIRGKTLLDYAKSYDNKDIIAIFKNNKEVQDNQTKTSCNSDEILDFFVTNKKKLRGRKQI